MCITKSGQVVFNPGKLILMLLVRMGKRASVLKAHTVHPKRCNLDLILGKRWSFTNDPTQYRQIAVFSVVLQFSQCCNGRTWIGFLMS